MKINRGILFSLILVILISGCDLLENENKKTQLDIAMQSSYENAEKLELTIQSMSVQVDSTWTPIIENQRVIEINLSPVNSAKASGEFTLIESNIDIDGVDKINAIEWKISSARLYADSVWTTLSLAFNSTNSLRQFVLFGEVDEGFNYDLRINLDLHQSLRKSSINESIVYFKPKARAYLLATTGNIEGLLSGWGKGALVYAIQSGDTIATTMADSSTQQFLLDELVPGFYTLSVDEEGSDPKVYTNDGQPYSVERGESTNVGFLTK